MDPNHFRKTEMDARFLPLEPEDAAFRVTDAGFLQLKDSATGEFRSVFLTNGAIQAGPAES
jgi:hypothetical protein